MRDTVDFPIIIIITIKYRIVALPSVDSHFFACLLAPHIAWIGVSGLVFSILVGNAISGKLPYCYELAMLLQRLRKHHGHDPSRRTCMFPCVYVSNSSN